VRQLRDRVYRRLHAAPPAPEAPSLRGLLAAGLVERARSADLVEIHWAAYARFTSTLRQAGVTTPVVVVEHDVEVQAFRRRLRAYASGVDRVVGVVMLPWHRRTERCGLDAADLVLVFKTADRLLLESIGVRTVIRVVDPWIDAPPELPARREPRRLLFTGAMFRRENSDGVLWFLRSVWPRVRARHPDAVLEVGGADPPPDLVSAAEAAGGVLVTGQVPDLLPLYSRAVLFVAPLLVGAGLKFKVAQAMACGLPVLTTPVGAEGFEAAVDAGVLWDVSDDPDRWVQRIGAAFADPAEADRVGQSAAEWARRTWSFERSDADLVAAYRLLVSRLR
jgi:glycosyltransferase involved in cell wall biosynthesis